MEQEPESTSHEQEALRAIRNVAGGADPGAEAFALSNAYTDRQVARLGRLWKRLRRRGADDDAG